MNSAKYVEGLIDDLNAKYSTGGIPLSDAMWEAGLACVGWPYVFGAWGALCTVSERKKRLSYNPSHTTIKTKCKAWDNGNCKGCQWFPDEERTRCFDCRGFEKWLYEQFGIFLEGQGATSQWNTKSNWCVQSDDMSAIPQGVLVSIFIKDGSSMSHTGFYFNGQTLECSNGVQHFNPMKKNRWTHWAVSYAFADKMNTLLPPQNAPVEPPVSADDKTDYPTLRRGDKGQKVRELQTLLLNHGYALPKYGADSDFGAETKKAVKACQRDWGLKEDGVAGPKTWEKLLTAPDKPKHYEVTITGLSKEEAEALCNKYSGVSVMKEMVG